MALIRCSSAPKVTINSLTESTNGAFDYNQTITSKNISIPSSGVYAWGAKTGYTSQITKPYINCIIVDGVIIWRDDIAANTWGVTIENGVLKGGVFNDGSGGKWVLYEIT